MGEAKEMQKAQTDVFKQIAEKKKKKKTRWYDEKKKKDKAKEKKGGLKKAPDETEVVGSVTKTVSGIQNLVSLGSKLKFIAMRGGGCIFIIDIIILLAFQVLEFCVDYYTKDYTSKKAQKKGPWTFMLIFAAISLCS